MSDIIKHHKVVSNLPSSLESNSVYYVRVGSGVTQYVTNDLGTITAYPPNPDASIPTGNADQYITGARGLASFGATVAATTLTGVSVVNSVITATDTVLSALGKAQGQINTREPAIAAGTTAQFLRGDKNWADVATAVRTTVLTGLSPVNSVIVATDTVLAAFNKTQGQINTREPAIAAGTTAQFLRGDKNWVDFASTARAVTLAGLSTSVSTDVVAGDTILSAIGKLQGQIIDSGWVNLTLVNGWTANTGFPLPSVRKIGNVVTLRGTIQVALANNNTPAFTLPVGYRPPGLYHFSNGGGPFLTTTGVTSIASNGVATCVDPAGQATCSVSLTGTSYFV